jgi:membrane protease subunit (stomatin/prohibitin family)
MDNMTFCDTSNNGELPCSFPPKDPRKIETGTIEKGETSKQKFSTSERSFLYNSFHNVEWHILPKSQQPVSSKDINKTYCTECGTKIVKSTFKFCPNCGTKLE